MSIGALVGPEAFTEVRFLAHQTQLAALEEIPKLAAEFSTVFGRPCPGLVDPYRVDGAEMVVLALGSVFGTVAEVVDELRRDGLAVGALGITTFRPFPTDAVRAQLRQAERVVVLERALAVGSGGVVSMDVRAALSGLETPLTTVVAGLGGRPVTRASLRDMFVGALAGRLPDLSFLDLHEPVLAGERRSERWSPSR